MRPFKTLPPASVAVFAALGCSAQPPSSPAPRPAIGPASQAVAPGLNQLRAATSRFKNLDSAVAVGYPKTVPDCLVHEKHGAMGYHHVNRDYLTKDLNVEKPQILLFERLGSGEYRLNGVEFIVPYRLWPRDSLPPTIMGQKMSHEDNLKIWYRHVWAWTDNPDGLFADFNPNVKCPTDSKVYTPYAATP